MADEQKVELEYLQWFHWNSDFGPADGDVRCYMNRRYTEETGNPLPPGYDEE